MKLKLSLFFATFIGFLVVTSTPVHAFPPELFFSFAFPVREFDSPLQTPIALPQAIVSAATTSATPLTWLLNYDALKNDTTTVYFQSLSNQPKQEIAALLEVTPQLLTDAKLHSGAVPTLLNSYLPNERLKLIDTYFDLFYSKFARYPSAIAADYIDSYSLSYLQSHYSIATALFLKPTAVFPLFSYYPSSSNAALPAQDAQHRIKVVISIYNPPDLFGRLITSDTIDSVLKDYAQKGINQNTRLVLGTDNQTPVNLYLPEFQKLLSSVANNRHPLSIHPATSLSDYGQWFLQYHPLTSPAYSYQATQDEKTIFYYHNPFYQLELEQVNGLTQLTHLTIFNQLLTEEFRLSRNLSSYWQPTFFLDIDSSHSVPINLDLKSAISSYHDWRLKLVDGGKSLELTPDGVVTKNLDLVLPKQPNIKTTTSGYDFDSRWLPFHSPPLITVINIFKLLLICLLIFFILRALKLYPKLILSTSSLVVIILGSIVWSLTTYNSGSLTDFGLSFWGPQGHDAFVHLSLIESFKHSFWPLINPTLAGTTVINYHILFDYLTALLSFSLNIPALDLYFRYLPPLMAVIIGLLATHLLNRFNFSKSAITISLVLMYMAGSLGFLPTLLLTSSPWGGESLFWANQSISTLLNPPFALSIILLLSWLNLFSTKPSKPRLVVLAALGGLLIQAKAYAAILLLLALALYCIRSPKSLILLILTILFTILFFLPTYAHSQSLFTFAPLWFVRSLVSSPDRLPWAWAANALVNAPITGSLIKFILIELALTAVFLVGNLGIRLLSWPFFANYKRASDPSLIIILNISIIGTLLPLLFIQAANPWNTIQFFYYTIFFAGLLTGPTIVKLIYGSRRLPGFLLLSFILVITTFSTTIGTLKDYISPTPSSYVSYSELKLLDQLLQLPRGLILSPEYHPGHSRPYSDPKPIFAYTTTAYQAALSTHPSFVADEINLSISNYNFADYIQQQQRFYRSTNPSVLNNIINANRISYIITNPQFTLPVPSDLLNLDLIFDSGYYKLYAVNK